MYIASAAFFIYLIFNKQDIVKFIFLWYYIYDYNQLYVTIKFKDVVDIILKKESRKWRTSPEKQ